MNITHPNSYIQIFSSYLFCSSSLLLSWLVWHFCCFFFFFIFLGLLTMRKIIKFAFAVKMTVVCLLGVGVSPLTYLGCLDLIFYRSSVWSVQRSIGPDAKRAPWTWASTRLAVVALFSLSSVFSVLCRFYTICKEFACHAKQPNGRAPQKRP